MSEPQAMRTLRFGDGADAYRANGDSGQTEGDLRARQHSINQTAELVELNSSHNVSFRHIVILSTGTLQQLDSWTGDLTRMSGDKIPVPVVVPAGQSQFAWEIPGRDQSMVGRDGMGYHPGTFLFADGAETIEPGDFVLAHIQGFETPLFRIYESARSYAPGVPFRLSALNPSYQPIEIPAQGACLKIAAVIGHFASMKRR
jgi:hypothetical protein